MKSTKIFLLLAVLSIMPAATASAVIQGLNGLTASTQFFTTTTDANIGLSVSSSGSTHTFNPTWVGILQPVRGGTGASTFATGSILFFQGGKVSEDNANFSWDDVNNRLGIGTSTPAYTLDIGGDVRWSGSLQGGSVPWSSLVSFPASCPPNQAVQAIGATLTCVAVGSGSVSSIEQGTGILLTPNPLTSTGTIAIDTDVVTRKTAAETITGSWTFTASSTAFDSTAYFPGSGIWDVNGNVGIGTQTPSQKLSVAGIIESTLGGFKFPDGTVQTSAASTSTLESGSKFGGTGSDGALSITNGTTILDLSTAVSDIFVKNYTSISITGGTLAFSNPTANGNLVILKSQGDCTLTSASSPMIDLRNIGGIGGSGGGFPGGSGGAGGSGTGNVVNATFFSSAATSRSTPNSIFGKSVWLSAGSGGNGGNGGAFIFGVGSGFGGAGGTGGGGLYIECGGNLNFTGTIDASGANGTNGTGGNQNSSGGGGGGGAGGSMVIIYSSLTANSGSFISNGGSGGSGGGSSAGSGGGAGGAGGAILFGGPRVAGNNGSGGNGGAGGSGQNGWSLTVQNTEF